MEVRSPQQLGKALCQIVWPRLAPGVGLIALLTASAVVAADNRPPFDDAPVFSPFRPLSANSERVFGDPNVAGRPFVVRIRELPGTIAPPHTHHFDENITVVRGTWKFGIGPKFDPAALHTLPAGSFIFIPRGTPMFGYAEEPVTVQVHGIGPFNQHFIAAAFSLTAADPDDGWVMDSTKFRFRAGQTVHSSRGSGRIQQGFATGEVVQYIIVRPNHELFMAQEKDMRTVTGR